MFIPRSIENITFKGVVKYTMTPQIAPRIHSFILAGFGNLAFFMAMVYQSVKLLPPNHPYLQKGMEGKYSIRDVLTEAANNITFDLKHIDQIIIFFALIAGLIILGIQFLLFITTILINPASAQAVMPAGYGQFFNTANPSGDIALRLLDKVFGVPNIFGSSEQTALPFHTALHGLFQFYSVGLLIIAAMILIYFIFVVLAETAQTGTPFGKRFNHAWAPVRLVVGIGLLIPISYGLNSAQWITLYAAKFGSGFATTGWITFHNTLTGAYSLPDTLVATPNNPDMKDIIAFMMMAHACKEAYVDQSTGSLNSGTPIKNIEAWVIDPDNAQAPQQLTVSFIQTLQYTKNRDILIRFGEYNPALYPDVESNVFPFCGDLKIIITEPAPPALGSNGQWQTSPTGTLNGGYFAIVYRLWDPADANYGQVLSNAANDMVRTRMQHGTFPTVPTNLKPTIIQTIDSHITRVLNNAMQQVIAAIQADTTFATLGWGGAGIWYNTIANINGQLVNALSSKPQIVQYASVMEYTCKENQAQNANTPPKDCYNPILSKGKPVKFEPELEGVRAEVLNAVFSYWHSDPKGVTGNAFIDTINAIFGTQGLFDMCNNANVHPLAQLSTLGKGLVEAAIRNLGFALGTGVAGILVPYIGPALGAASSFFVTVASIGILIGFMLYYIVPFMPFLYFLFAVGGWVKGIFEAMVGVPLWALAHLRIDGQGLPGDGAINGYFLIFEIFIRPILIVFGLLASILIFGAMVKVLNEIFSLVVTNLSGNDPNLSTSCGGGSPTPVQQQMQANTATYFRGPIDEFFYTIVYAILVYMIGMSSFKLIDLIPNNILRWMGQGVHTFGDQAGEPAEGLMTKMAVGGSVMGGQLQGIGSAAGQMGGNLAAAAKNLAS